MIQNSASVVVNVYPQLQTGGISPGNQAIKFNGIPAQMSISATGGDNSYSYQWYSDGTGGFQQVATGPTYSPPALSTTTNYYANVISNGVQVTTGTVTVTVFPKLQCGTITPASQTIAFGAHPDTMTLNGVSGGSGSYTYLWQYSKDASFSSPVSIPFSNWYILGAESLPSNTWFRVIVASAGDTIYSPIAVVNVVPRLTAGVISPSTMTLPAGGDPGQLSSSAAIGGNCVPSAYQYLWQSSTNNVAFSDIGGASDLTFSPGVINASIYYRIRVACGSDTSYSRSASFTVIPAPDSGQDLNYIRTRTFNRAGVTDTVTADGLTDPHDVSQVTQYFDGLGRPMQTVSRQASPLQKDMVSMQIYDPFGREVLKYLPYTSQANDGNFKTNAVSEQAAFNSSQFPNEHSYYGRTDYDASPLNRVLGDYQAGDSWAGAGRGVTKGYLFNTAADSVQIWNIGYAAGSLPVNAGAYSAGQLRKTLITDEQGHQVVEYRDFADQVVLKKVQLADVPGNAHAGWLCTYYVYDDLNNLRFVIPPKAAEWLAGNGWSLGAAGGGQVAAELCFRYEFDGRRRMIVKQVPGKGEDWMIFDVRDRLVFSQDANQRVSGQWINTQYDGLDRTVLVGQMNDTANRADLQQTVTALSTTGSIAPLLVADLYLSKPDQQGDTVATDLIDMQDGFSTKVDGNFSGGIVPPGSITSGYPSGALPVSLNPIPTGTTVQPLIINYYDNYDWVASTGSGLGTTLATDKTGSFITQFNTSPDYAVRIAANPIVRGQATGTMHLILGENRPLYTVNFYDDRDRPIQSRTMNYSGGVDTLTSQYDFSGKAIRTLLTHYKAGTGSQYHTVMTKMDYDPGFRLLHVWKNIDGAPIDQLISSQQYNELGQLTSKGLGNNLDNINYDYNIRGWLSSINQDYISSTSSTPLHYFGMQLGYDKSQAGATGTTFKNLQYNGNISGWMWKSAGDGVNRQYDFTYDNVNRLTGADFNQQFTGGWGKSDPSNSGAAMDYSVSNLRYDANGNILGMQQKGFRIGKPVDPIDMLGYNYQANTNKLAGVTDTANDASSKLGDFHYNEGSKGAIDYTYDANGNLISDQNKSITGIVYNYLNLPQQITVNGKGTISYTYDAAGVKLKKTTVDNTVTPAKTTVTTYIDGIQYQNDSLQFVGHEEGRARWALHNYTTGTSGYGWEYDFFEKDHLGNTRVVLTQQRDTAQYMATMEATYRAKEMALFYNIDSTSYPAALVPGGFPNIGPPTPNDSVARVNGSPGGHKMGPAILLKVMSGDSVAFGTRYFYRSNASPGPDHSSLQDVMTSLAQGLLTVAGGGHGAIADLNNTSGSPVYAALNSFLPANEQDVTGKPKAYLNWMLLDNQFNYVGGNGQSGAQQVGAPDILNPPLAQALKLNHSGYLYIWVSNETENWDVFFDNLSVSHYSGPMVEENHYYPFGLTMAGISDKALKSQYHENKYKFNGGNELQNKEFSDGSGLEVYDATHRMYDPQIGRFFQIDHLPEFNVDLSPYSFANNDPISFNDPLGDTTTLPTVTVTAKKPLDTKNGQVYGHQSFLDNLWNGNRVWVGHIHNLTLNYEVDRNGYLTGRLSPQLLLFDPPLAPTEKPINLKALFNLKNFIKGRYLIYMYTKDGLPYVGKALGSLVARYGSEERVFQLGVEVFRGLDNIPNNAIALGVEQLVVDLNGGVKSGMLANINNPTIKEIYINEARNWLDHNMPNWEQVLKFQ